MAVLKIEEYRQKNGVLILKVFCKPTKKFPQGSNFFYCPAEAISLVQKYSWFLSQAENRVVVIVTIGSRYCKKNILFHKELFKFYRGYNWEDDIDHINHIEIDNTDQNLNAITRQQNQYNRFTRGYRYCNRYKYFQPIIVINSKPYYLSVIHREDETCILQNRLEQIDLKEKLQDQYYMFNFLKYRRGDESILDLERTGKISEEEAIYRHIIGYSENAWYYLRYGLEQYFKDYNIPVPKYSLDTNGFMTHPITGQKLCPFS